MFHYFDSSDENIKGSHAMPMKLLELKSGSLRHFKETKCNVVESAELTKFWCEYPPPKLNEHVMQVGDDFLKKKLKNHVELENLIVTPLFDTVNLEHQSLTSMWDQNHVVLIPS